MHNNNNSCADDIAGCVISSVNPPQALAFLSTPGAGSSHAGVVRAAFHVHLSSRFRNTTLLCRASWMGLVAPNWALEGSVSIDVFAVSLWCNGDKPSLSFGFPLLQDTGPIFPSHRDLQAGKALWNPWKVTEQAKDFTFYSKKKKSISFLWQPDFCSKSGTWKSPRQWWTLWNQPVPRGLWKWLFHESFPKGRRGSFHLSVVVSLCCGSQFFLSNNPQQLSCLTQIFLR